MKKSSLASVLAATGRLHDLSFAIGNSHSPRARPDGATTKDTLMKYPPLRAALLGCCATLAVVSIPATADELSDLKAEIQAQKALSEAQKARLDALEKKLQAVTEQKVAAPEAKPAPTKVPLALTTDQNGNEITSSTPVTLYSGDKTRISIYGILEPTIGHANHQSPTGGTTTGFQVSWFSGNRLGFDADHALDLGDSIGLPGLKVISKLESEMELPSGGNDTAGNLFVRDAWVGFYSDDLGKLTFGRQNTLTRDFTQNWGDAYGTPEVTLREGGYSNVNNFKQLIFYSGASGGRTRMDSAVEWKKKWGQHWVTGLAYGFGFRGNGGSADPGEGGALPGQFTNGTTQEVSVAYNGLDVGAGRFNLNANYDRANVNNLIHHSELVGGNYVIGPVRVNAGYIWYTAEQGVGNSAGSRKDKAWTTSASLRTGKTIFSLGYQKSKGDHSGFNAAGVTINPFGNTSGVTTVGDGSKTAVFGSIVYQADKQLDFYIASDYFKVNGGWALHDALGNGNIFGQGGPFKDEVEVATGARFKF